MLYTIGRRESYDLGIIQGLKNNKPLMKMGVNPYYSGGIIFKTREEAWEYLAETGHLNTYAVYGVDADWNRDTLLDKRLFKPFRRLQVNSLIIQLEKEH